MRGRAVAEDGVSPATQREARTKWVGDGAVAVWRGVTPAVFREGSREEARQRRRRRETGEIE